jgi:hypothetical protein
MGGGAVTTVRTIKIFIHTCEGGQSHLCSELCPMLDVGFFGSAKCRASDDAPLAKLPSGEFQRTRFCLEEAK